MAKRPQIVDMATAAAVVENGARLGIGGGNALWRRPVSFVRELLRQQTDNLHLYQMIGGLETDMLLGAGKVASTNTCYVGLDEFGQSPHFQRAARDHSVEIVEYSEFTFVASLRAAGMGLPFLPWKTAWGTDIVSHLGWKTVTCPYTGMDLLAVPANNLDVAVIQAHRCDEAGNMEVGLPLDFIHDFDLLIARAADVVIVCAEEIADLSDPTRTGLIGGEVDYVVHAPQGCWPGGLIPKYQMDARHLAEEYMPATGSPEAFAAYLQRFVYDGEAAR